MRNENSPLSDVDVLVDFEGPASFRNFFELQRRLEDSLGVKVDLVTRDSLRPELKEKIEREAVRVA